MRWLLVVFMALILLRCFPDSKRFSYLLLFNYYRYKNEEKVIGVGLIITIVFMGTLFQWISFLFFNISRIECSSIDFKSVQLYSFHGDCTPFITVVAFRTDVKCLSSCLMFDYFFGKHCVKKKQNTTLSFNKILIRTLRFNARTLMYGILVMKEW